ncbi:MAG: roadblock/LC7 domain-containing protein [Actinophytocola sp.]|uniref:roadblock/LC7 domain-containing protein n=1 Tax=Actinophytocola sp. TaxID=1872138 RepID=UPI003D6BD11F
MSTAPDAMAEVRSFNWLLNRFASDTAGVVEAIAVSSDGLLMARSESADRPDADRLAAVTSAIMSLAVGASDCYQLGDPDKVIIELSRGYVLVCTVSAGSVLGVLASKQANLGTIAYEMALFANRAGAVLTPQLIEKLKLSVDA